MKVYVMSLNEPDGGSFVTGVYVDEIEAIREMLNKEMKCEYYYTYEEWEVTGEPQ